MASIAPFFERLKPALDNFIRNSTRENLKLLENELTAFNWLESKIVHVHILLPLVLKLEELNGKEQELRTGLLNCIRLVLSNIYLSDIKSFFTILTIVLKQVRNFDKAITLPNLSEEIKLAAVLCIDVAFQRTSTDVLELFYTKQSTSLLGHILLFLVELIELEQYRKLKFAAIECMTVVFYVHDKADVGDVVLRSQVADTLFIYLPKVIGVLFKTFMADEKIGETLKAKAIRALGFILYLIYEDSNEIDAEKNYNSKEFKKLLESLTISGSKSSENLILEGSKFEKDKLEEMLTRMQTKGRSSQWFRETSLRINGIFRQMNVLRSHTSYNVRLEFATMCANLIEHCTHNLKENFLMILENLIALAEDESVEIAQLCSKTLKKLQQHTQSFTIFDECADTLFEQHSLKFLQIIHRKDESEFYAELLFLKGFLQNVDSRKLAALFSLNTFLQQFCLILITAVDLEITPDFLNEEYALRNFDESIYCECLKLKWRRFKYLESQRCVTLLQKICILLGSKKDINYLLFDCIFESFQDQKQRRINEALLILTWMFTPQVFSKKDEKCKEQKTNANKFSDLVLKEIFNDIHWNLALHADAVSHLRVDKPSNWFVERTPGLYESAYEMRMQDYDSDDEQMQEDSVHVTAIDAQWNVLHTCMILDALGHFAKNLGSSFKKYIFHSLHKVLLKIASSNTMVYEAGIFALISLQSALGYDNITKFIENHTDYISYHLNMQLRRTPDSSSAVDILSVVLQLSSHNSLPHLENIFETLREECGKTNQSQNISAYLRVFNAFLVNVERWSLSSELEIAQATEDKNPIDGNLNSKDILANWLSILEKTAIDLDEPMLNENFKENEVTENEEIDSDETKLTNECCDNNDEIKAELPRHIQMVKQILQETLKFLSNVTQAHQIQSLECLIIGVPLLKNYEDDLLPLVHTIWQPLIEKFRQKDPLVLNRCFTLLNVLSTYAKEFIHKRSLDDVIPYLKTFLRDSSLHSATEHSNAQTQLYKLQLKLLQEFSNLIISMQIDVRHLNDIAEVIALYLSEKQPIELQNSAVKFFLDLSCYNKPLMYLIASKKLYLKDFKTNVSKIMSKFNIKPK